MKSMMTAFVMGAALMVSGSAKAQALGLEDRAAIVDAITDIAAGADRRDWPRVRGAFAETVTLDYTSLWGGAPATLPADEVVAQWSGFLPGFDRTLHLVTNHAILESTADSAVAEADFEAAHRIGSEMWVLMGHYRYQLVRGGGGWKVSGMAMDWTHETGDRGLVEKAAARARK